MCIFDYNEIFMNVTQLSTNITLKLYRRRLVDVIYSYVEKNALPYQFINILISIDGILPSILHYAKDLKIPMRILYYLHVAQLYMRDMSIN